MQEYLYENHAPSHLPEGHQWKLVWNDEFDGLELDRTKWLFRLYFWGKRFPAFTDQGVELDGESHLRLHLVKNPDGTYSSPHLQTGSLTFDIPKDPKNKFWLFGEQPRPTFMHRYGFYEIRCRFPKCDGWHSAFWLQAPGVGSHPDARVAGVECDIMENYRLYTENKIVGGNLWGGYGKECGGSGHFRWNHEETPDRWHYYAVNWTPTGYDFYIDGKLRGRVTPNPEDFVAELDADGHPCGGVRTGPVSQIEQFLLVSTECHGYRTNGVYDPLLDKAILPDYFEVDHVRVFDDVDLVSKLSTGGNTGADGEKDGVFMF
ncbi:MAG: glycoside hydrolase family 16 protein [Victivallales bacterium]|nr:glycoside hydrolase family 16 protein [Victivallales bacterium]